MKAGNVGMKEAVTEEEVAVVVGRAGALKAPNGSNPELLVPVGPGRTEWEGIEQVM